MDGGMRLNSKRSQAFRGVWVAHPLHQIVQFVGHSKNPWKRLAAKPAIIFAVLGQDVLVTRQQLVHGAGQGVNIRSTKVIEVASEDLPENTWKNVKRTKKAQ